MIEIATVNYAAFKPEMGLAVRTSVGAPRYFEYRPLATWEAVYPQYNWLKLSYDDYHGRYLAKLDEYGADNMRADIDALAEICRDHVENQRLLLCCYETLAKPGAWCHRSMLSRWLTENLGIEVLELGKMPKPVAPVLDPDPTLF